MLARRLNRSRKSLSHLSLERLESRELLTVGPFLHTHNANQLAVIDATTGEFQATKTLDGYEEGDGQLADVAFGTDSTLYGITSEWLYEINPVTGQLTTLGQHDVPDAKALIVSPSGSLQAMGRLSPDLFELTIQRAGDETSVNTRSLGTLDQLVGLAETVHGDIAYRGDEIAVATDDGRLLWYRFAIGRPQFRREYDLASLNVAELTGLAVVDDVLYGTTANSIVEFDLTNLQAPAVASEITTSNDFGILRGLAFYGESGGPVPVGTLSGVKWHDRNGDGIRGFGDDPLPNWQVYIDSNVNGRLDPGEPETRTDDNGRYHFFGFEEGLYTVDEIVPNPAQWTQTFPRTPHRNLVGLYSFTTQVQLNELSHDFGLPDLNAVGAAQGIGGVVVMSNSSHLEVPVPLGEGPFTVALDATYDATFNVGETIVSQRLNPATDATDFALIADAETHVLRGSFCNQAGACFESAQTALDGARHSMALTWNGSRVGTFLDTGLVTRAVTGTLPDIDGEVMRIGNPVGATTPTGLRGTIFEVRIYNAELSEADLRTAFSAPEVANAYSVYLDDNVGLGDLDFGNTDMIVDPPDGPEIDVRRNTATGPVIVDGGQLDLGTATLPTALRTEVFVRNDGDASLTLSTFQVTGPFGLDGATPTVLAPGQTMSFFVQPTDASVGLKTGSIQIGNTDADENPYDINLSAIISTIPVVGPRQLLVSTANGTLNRVDEGTGAAEILVAGLPAFADVAHHPTNGKIYAIDTTNVYEVLLGQQRARALFAHGVAAASGLGFSPTGELFMTGNDVFSVNLDTSSVTPFATIGSAAGGDVGFLAGDMYVSTGAGNLHVVRGGTATLVGNLDSIPMRGLAQIGNGLFGVSDQQFYQINVAAPSATPIFSPSLLTYSGLTYQPEVSATNTVNRLDVDGNGAVVPLDALRIINELNAPTFTHPETRLIIGVPTQDTPFPDVDGDGFVTPTDAIRVINRLNELAAEPEGEAEAEASDESSAAPAVPVLSRSLPTSQRAPAQDLALSGLFWGDDVEDDDDDRERRRHGLLT